MEKTKPMKLELRYYAQLYRGLEIMNAKKHHFLPSNVNLILLGKFDELEKWYSFKEALLNRQFFY
jgi:hypothetical protein